MSDDVTITFGGDVAETLRKAADHLRGDEPIREHGSKRMDEATKDELVSLRSLARAAAETFSEAVKAQAEACGLSRGALRRYICALEADKLDQLDMEADDLARLMTRDGGGNAANQDD